MREFLIKLMAAKKKTTKKVDAPAPAETNTQIVHVKGPNHIVKDGQIILDPKIANPGVFSSPA